MRQIPQQMSSLKAGAADRRRYAAGRTPGLYGYGRISRVVADYAGRSA
jgi:D-3-phosphoglycerate dehydrogenase